MSLCKAQFKGLDTSARFVNKDLVDLVGQQRDVAFAKTDLYRVGFKGLDTSKRRLALRDKTRLTFLVIGV